MAVLNSIRKRGVFLIIIIAMALFAFVLGDILKSGGGGGDFETTAAVINGQEVNRTEFMTKVENFQRSRGANFPQSQAMKSVWDNEVREILFGQQADELGLVVSDDELSEQLAASLANQPQFQDENGAYSEQLMIEYAASINRFPNSQEKQQWDTFINSIKSNIIQNRYVQLIQSGMNTTLSDGKQQYHFENDKINVEFVFVPYTSIADEDIAVTDDEIRNYIKSHPDQYEIDPLIDIEYVSFVEEPSLEDIEAAETEMNELATSFKTAEDVELFVGNNSDNNYVDRWYYPNNIPASLKDTIMGFNSGDVYGPYKVDNTYNITRVLQKRQLPDTVEARHILVPIGLNRTDSITRTKEQAKSLADSLYTVVKSNKGKFGELAKDFSGDLATNEKEGDLGSFGYLKYASIVPLNDYLFQNDRGSMGVVETNYGYHVVEIIDNKNMTDVIKYATVTKEIEPSEETLSLVFSEAAKFEEAVRAGDFSAVATEKGLTPRPVNKIGEMDSNIPGIGDNRSIVSWGFNEETEVGDIKRFDVGETYVIARLNRKSTTKALMSVAEASATVTPILRNEKKAQKIRASISGSTLQEVATSQNVTVKTANAITRSAPTIPGVGNEPYAVGTAFGVANGESTSLIDGENGVLQIRVLSKEVAPDLDNYISYINTLKGTNNINTIRTTVFEALKDKADIQDNRGKFF